MLASRPASRAVVVLVTTVVTAAAALALAACGGPVVFDGGGEAGLDAADASVDTPPPPPDTAPGDAVRLGRACTRAEQCDDGLECTDDTCGVEGRCVNAPRNDRCDDGVYCNGGERCDVARGCVRGAPVDCNDDEVCTQ